MNKTPQSTISVILVSKSGIKDLAVALPGLESQSVVDEIELLLVFPEYSNHDAIFTDRPGLRAFNNVKVTVVPDVSNRWIAAKAALPKASGLYVALHENHTRLLPDTYERLLDYFALNKDAGGVCPLVKPANPESPWGWAVYSISHGHAAFKHQAGVRETLPEHQSLFRLSLVQNFSTASNSEYDFQKSLRKSGVDLHLDSSCEFQHINESRPDLVTETAWRIALRFGSSRPESRRNVIIRMAFLISFPIIFAITLLRLLRCISAHDDFTLRMSKMMWPIIKTSAYFALGEVSGVWCARANSMTGFEPHELDIVERLAGIRPESSWLAESISELQNH